MFLVTFTCCLVYTIAQQSLRLGANELPTQLATDTSIKLENGQNLESALPSDKIDISKSLNTFVMVYDNNKNLVAESGMMGASKPAYPKGVLSYVDQKGESKVTWQTQTGVRFATIAIKYKDGYIVAARSLKETEKLIDTVGKLVLLAWLAFAIFSALASGTIYLSIKKIYTMKKSKT
jgi:hypothetical protein